MTVWSEVRPSGELTDEKEAALDALRAAVFVPEVAAAWPGRHREWVGAMYRVLVWDAGGALVAHAGLVLRDGYWNGDPVHIGGIGGVMTHPKRRRQGLAALAMRRAVDFFHMQGTVDFALLVCEPRLLPYYHSLGWQEFGGRLCVRQWNETEAFTFNRVMTHPVRDTAPRTGDVDLMGPPW